MRSVLAILERCGAEIRALLGQHVPAANPAGPAANATGTLPSGGRPSIDRRLRDGGSLQAPLSPRGQYPIRP